jgi:hypothetical protein
MLMTGLLRRTISAFTTITLALAAGCDGSGTDNSSNGTGAGGGGGENAGGGGAGGGGGESAACGEGPTIVLAMDRMLMGETNPDLTPNPSDGWRQYGLDLDGRASVEGSSDLCKPVMGAASSEVYPDGDGGIDNAFGKVIAPLIAEISGGVPLTKDAAEHINTGTLTYLITLEGLGALSSCALPASKLYRGYKMPNHPNFDGTDEWPLEPSMLEAPADPASAKNVFLESAVVDNQYQSGPEANFSFVLDVKGAPLVLPIRHGRLQMTLDPDHQGATMGQLGGVLDTEDLVKSLLEFGAHFDPSICDPNSAARESLVSRIRQASDILSDGTQDPSKDCSGISIGIGFTMKHAKLGQVGKPLWQVPPVCMP